MILLLGATGYIGQAFANELQRRSCQFIPLSRRAFDYTRFDLLFDYVRKMRPRFLINAAGISGQHHGDVGEGHRLRMFEANTLLPQTIARVCLVTNTPWAHVSSGGIYSGAKVHDGGELRVERDLDAPSVRRLFAHHRERFAGFSELDEPNYSFRCPPCSFCEGVKALGEEALRHGEQTFIWRSKEPFGECDDPRNLLSKLQANGGNHYRLTSLSHVGDFARACLDLVDRGSAFGTYNIINPGAVTTGQIMNMIQRALKPARVFPSAADPVRFPGPQSAPFGPSCILDSTKLLRAGVKLRPVERALQDALNRWTASTSSDIPGWAGHDALLAR